MKTLLRFLCCFCLLTIFVLLLGAQTPTYDLLIRGGRIVDGTGSSWWRGDIAVRGDTIAALGKLDNATARRVIEAQDLIVAPGFIDIHSHSRDAIFAVPTAENAIREGVTTVIDGNDGSSPLPLKPFFDQLTNARIGINFGMFVGQGSILNQVLGNVDRKATPEEIGKMKALVKQAMEDGAFG